MNTITDRQAKQIEISVRALHWNHLCSIPYISCGYYTADYDEKGEIEGLFPSTLEEATHFVIRADVACPEHALYEVLEKCGISADIDVNGDNDEAIFKLEHKGLRASDYDNVGLLKAVNDEREKLSTFARHHDITTNEGFNAVQGALFKMNMAIYEAMLPCEREQYGTIFRLEKSGKAFILSVVPIGSTGEPHAWLNDCIMLSAIAGALRLDTSRPMREHDSDREPCAYRFNL